jgi:acyl-coenzyme A synthetase/AMP-(fatty) acid ligase
MLSVVEPAGGLPCPRPFNLAAHVLARGVDQADKSALQIVRPSGAERWSYGRLIAAVRGCGAGLLARGLVSGDRVMLRLGNGPAFPVAFLGAIAAGLVPVPTSAELTRPEVERLIAQLRPSALIADQGLAMPANPDLPVIPATEILAMERLAPCDWAMGEPDRLAYMVFTSGSTGHPRAVMHAHRAVWARRMMHEGWQGLTEADRLLHAGALNWTYTLGVGLLDPWSVGATALIPAPGVEPGQIPLLLKRFDATIFAAAPGVYRQMLKSPFNPSPKLRHGLSAGEKLPDLVRDAWVSATGRPIYEALGMSECSTFVSGSPARPTPAGAIGYPQPGRRIAVLDAGGRPVPRGEPGTLAVHRSDPGLFLGYFDADEETAASFRGDWFLTGDSVALSEDGAITYIGRQDDVMNAGGFRLSPLEVEAAMNSCPGVTETAVTEVEAKPGVRVIACFYVAPQPVAETVLFSHAEASLARYKQPRIYVHRTSLTLGANTKLSRRALRQEWESLHAET